MSGAGGNVELTFRLQQITAAEDAAKRVLVAVRQATDVSKETRREITQQAKGDLQQLRALKTQELERQRLGKRFEELRDQVSGTGIGVPLGELNKSRNALGLTASLAQGNLAALGGVAGMIAGPLGAAIGAMIVKAIEAAKAAIDAATDAKVARLNEKFQADLDDMARRLDYARRLKEDPVFAAQQSREAFELTTRDEAAAAAAGLRPADDLLEGF